MIVVAYFNYTTGRSNIRSFTNDEDAKKWLYEEWGFMLNKQLSYNDLSFEQLCKELRDFDDCEGVIIEYLRL